MPGHDHYGSLTPIATIARNCVNILTPLCAHTQPSKTPDGSKMGRLLPVCSHVHGPLRQTCACMQMHAPQRLSADQHAACNYMRGFAPAPSGGAVHSSVTHKVHKVYAFARAAVAASSSDDSFASERCCSPGASPMQGTTTSATAKSSSCNGRSSGGGGGGSSSSFSRFTQAGALLRGAHLRMRRPACRQVAAVAART